MKFRKKPVVIEAFRLGYDDAPKWFTDAIIGSGSKKPRITPVTWLDVDGGVVRGCKIMTLEGEHIAQSGDWIIKGVEGELYPCKHTIFMKTYEPAEE